MIINKHIGKMRKTSGVIEVDIYDIDFTIETDNGVRTYPNGDPGYPPSHEITINKITTLDENGNDVIVDEMELDAKVVESIYEAINDYKD